MKFRKHFIRWLSLLLSIVTVVGVTVAHAADAAPAATDELSLLGKTIYVPEGTLESSVTWTAATELKIYLEKMTGTEYTIQKKNSVLLGNSIFVGNTKQASSNGVTPYPDAQGNGEGWSIEAKNGSLFLTGGETRGVLYAVYHLLEDVLGVRWWNMWEEYVPSGEPVIPADLKLSGEPVFTYRDAYFAESAESLFAIRNRMNGFASSGYDSETLAKYGGELDFSAPYHTHTFSHIIKDTDFAAHSEWFSLDAETNSRQYYIAPTTEDPGVEAQLCLTNGELIGVFAQRVKDYIAASPDATYASVTANDCGGHCECENCMAVRNKSGLTGYMLQFVNKIAAAVAVDHPDIKVETLIYASYLDLPLDDTVPADNVVIRLACSDMDIMHDLDHPTNVKVKDRIDAWAKLVKPGQLLYWDYAMMTNRYNGTMPNFFRFAEDYKKLLDAGFSGVFAENGAMNCAEMWDARNWILMKVIEDPTVTVREVAKEFTKGYYGEAGGEEVYNYMDHAAQLAEDYYDLTSFASITIGAEWMTGEDAATLNSYFDSAVAKTKAEPTITEADRQLYLNRINAARNALDRTLLYNYNRFSSELAESGRSLGTSREEIGRRMYAGLEWLDNMMAGEDLSGIQNPPTRHDAGTQAWYLMSRYQRYAGEKAADGNAWYPAVPQEVYDENPDLDSQHIYSYPAVTFNIYDGKATLVPNAGSVPGSSAVVIDQKASIAAGNQHCTFSSTRRLYTNLEGNLTVGAPFVIDDEQYHVYKLEDVMVFGPGRPYINMLNCFDVAMEGLDHLYGKKGVDVYFSMKIEGDPSSGEAKIYIDHLIVVEDCSFHEVNADIQEGATCNSNAYGVGPCPICGKQTRFEVAGTKLPHATTGTYTYNEADGSYSTSCSVCDEAVYYQFDHKLPEDLLDYLKQYGIGLEHVREYDIDDFYISGTGADMVSDTDTPVRKAAVRSSSSGIDLAFQTVGSTNVNFGAPNMEQVHSNANGGYKTYELTGGIVPTGSVNYWCTFSSAVQSKVLINELANLAGQPVKAYMSLKCTKTFGGPYYYYLDRIFLVEPCGGCGAGRATDNFAVRFNTDGGSYVAEVGVKSGNTLTAPAAPTKEGYDFQGWYLNDAAYDFSAPVTKPMTLTAKWGGEYTVAFNIDGVISTQTVMEGTTVAEPAAPAKEGYVFLGWYNGDAKYNFSTPITGNLTLVAKYEEEVAPEYQIKGTSASLSLQDEVFMNVTFQLRDMDNKAIANMGEYTDNVGLLVWNADNVPEDPKFENAEFLLDAEYDSALNRFTTQTDGIPAKELGDALAFRPYYADGNGNYIYGMLIASYSAKQYAYNRIKANASAKEVALNVAILNYGAAAQKYFGYKVDDLMNADLTEDQQAMNWDDSLVRADYSVPAEKKGDLIKDAAVFASAGGNLDLIGAINTRFYYNVTNAYVGSDIKMLLWTEAEYNAVDVLSKDNATIVDMEWNEDTKRYEYVYEGVAAKNMFTTLYACPVYTDAEGVDHYGAVLAYSAERFAYLNKNKTGENAALAELAKRIVIYGDAARTFFGN